jgi:hypothetical protein
MTRSTGYRSQNHHLHAHCADIGEQACVPKHAVYQAICLEAVEEDILAYRILWGKMIPDHESEWTTEQCANVLTLTHKIADQHNYWLTEYDDSIPPKAVRMWAGKPKEEARGHEGP